MAGSPTLPKDSCMGDFMRLRVAAEDFYVT
jgi:hypothetical protein